MVGKCGVCVPDWHDDGGRLKLPTDCHLKDGHNGRHEYINHEGILISWETDMDCDCEDCRSEDADDWCIVYQEGNKGDEHEEHY